MNRRAVILVLLTLFGSNASGDEQRIYAYVWLPRAADVGAPGSSDYRLLEALLLLSKPTNYTVVDGDSVDFIIRKQFLVSQQQRHAFSLYLKRIHELNKTLRTDPLLKLGSVLLLPGGPKYGGTELESSLVPEDTKEKTFKEMSKKAYSLGVVTEEKIEEFATRSLGAFVTQKRSQDRPKLYQVIKKRGLVYPIDTKKYPESALRQTQALSLAAADEVTREAINTIREIDPEHLLPGMFPVSNSKSVQCTQPCIDCSTALRVPPRVDVHGARVLVQDTGVRAGLVDSQHILPQSATDDANDVSPEFHGTFVYSELAAPEDPSVKNLFGIIPKENVYVAKTVRESDGTQFFWMPAILNSWQQFSDRMSHDNSAAKTWIVNVSAFGEPVPDLLHPPSIPEDGHLLIVAAAGNNASETEPPLVAFPRMSNGSSTLLIAGALGTNGEKASYSNWNASYVQFFAPGDCVCGAPGQINGTSQAVPFVTAAAAILASMRPNWNPRYVMWRLISTADHPDTLKGKASAGVVNLTRALDASIIVTETKNNGAQTIHHANSIKYDSSWRQAFQAKAINKPGAETLRLYSLTTSTATHETCFTSMQFLYPTYEQFCVDSNATIAITEGSSTLEFKANELLDLVLPMPEDDGSHLPDIVVAGQP